MSANDTGDERVRHSELQRIYDDAHATIERRALIEQTKGMLMFIYGVDADAAFEMLRQQSRPHGIKVQLIAEQISKDLIELSKQAPPVGRRTSDSVMFTAHRRITEVIARLSNGRSKIE